MSRLDDNVANNFIGAIDRWVLTNMLSSEQDIVIWCISSCFATAPKDGPFGIVVRHDLSQHNGTRVQVRIRLFFTDPRRTTILVVSDGAHILACFNLATVEHFPGALFHHDAVNITTP
jgi:hypothetical protein